MKKHFLTTGEFAKLCRTTKETLFHYDKMNLLKPKHVSENGYRYYGSEQFFEFDLICLLKETGTPLKQIRELVDNMGGERLVSLLEEKRLVIHKEKDRLTQREDMLRGMICCTRESVYLEYDSFQVQEQDEERLEVLPTAASPLEPTAEFAGRFADYVAYYEQEDRIPSYPYGVILAQADLAVGQYLETFLFSRATQFTPEFQLHIKPGGKYAVLAHQGTVQTHLEAFGGLVTQIRRAGLTIAGDAYVYDMMSIFLMGGGSVHSSKYCIRVE